MAKSSRGAAGVASGHAGMAVGGRSAAGASSAGRTGGREAGESGMATHPLVRSAARMRDVVRRGCMTITLPERSGA